MALYENALNQTGNDTHLSYARCSPRYLGVSLCGKYISCKPMEETEIVANVSLARLPQRDMVCLCCMPISLWDIWTGVWVGNPNVGNQWSRQRILPTFLVVSLNDTWYVSAVWQYLGTP